MNKEKFLRVYNKLSIAFGVMILLFVILFTAQFPQVYNGLITKSFFQISIENSLNTINILNAPLFVYISLVFLNIYLMIRVKNTSDVKSKLLQNILFYNTMLVLMLILGHFVFYMMVPEAINGTVVNKFVYLRLQVRSDEFVNIINVNYILSIIFLGYNLVVAFMTSEPKEKVFDEEIYEKEFFDSIEENK